jgi:hypothetical protein
MTATHPVDLVALCNGILQNQEVRSIVIVWYPNRFLQPIVRTVTSASDLVSEVDQLRGVIEGTVLLTFLAQLPERVAADQLLPMLTRMSAGRTWPMIPGGWHPSLVTDVDNGQTSSLVQCTGAFRYASG